MSSAIEIQRLLKTVSEAETMEERFQRFLDGIDEDDKAEFIDGQIVMHSPALPRHIRVAKRLLKILDTYIEGAKENGTAKGEIALEQALCRFDLKNAFMPDLAYWGPQKTEQIRADYGLFPVPDFIVEILSKSTMHNDKIVKLRAYAQHGVSEYWIINPMAGKEGVERYILTPTGHTYTLRPSEDYLNVSLFPDLRFPQAALFSDAECNTVLDGMWRAVIEPPMLAQIEKEKARADEETKRAEVEKERAEVEKARAVEALTEVRRLKIETSRALLQAGIEPAKVAEITELSINEIENLPPKEA